MGRGADLIPLIIFGIIIVFRVLSAMKGQERRRRESGDNEWEALADSDAWQDWEGKPRPGGASTARSGTSAAASPTRRPESPPVSRQTDGPLPVPPPIVRRASPPAGTAGPQRPVVALPSRPHTSTASRRPLPRQAGGSAAAKEQVQLQDMSEAELAQMALAKAFPKAMNAVRQVRVGARRPIVVRTGGAAGVRNAIIMSEALARPRAFDV